MVHSALPVCELSLERGPEPDRKRPSESMLNKQLGEELDKLVMCNVCANFSGVNTSLHGRFQSTSGLTTNSQEFLKF